MSSIGTGYDLSVSTYSPEGRLFQVEYALKAVENSGTALGIKCKDGVVLAVEKLVASPLLVKGSNRRIASADRHIGVATSGLLADSRHLVARARDDCQSYEDTYKEAISGKMLADRLGQYVQAYTLYSSVRPFGVTAILGSWDPFPVDSTTAQGRVEQRKARQSGTATATGSSLAQSTGTTSTDWRPEPTATKIASSGPRMSTGGPSLYVIEPSGVYWGYQGTAVGKGRQLAKTEIEKLKLGEISARDAVKEAARIIYLTHDAAKDKEFELEISWVCEESQGRHMPVPDALLQEAEAAAKASLSADMEE